MTAYLLAGGGTAGHVNPLLAVADALRERDPSSEIIVLGTAEGLESRLVPQRGYELLTIPKLPFPRRPNRDALVFWPRYRSTVTTVADIIRTRKIDGVVGFGGYAAAPSYSAARREQVPVVIHEANARPGLANKWGARHTPFVGVAFEGTRIAHGRYVGMPLRPEIENLDSGAVRQEARTFFGLDPDRPTLLVTGGSLGARRLNTTLVASAEQLVATGYQVLHIVGARSDVCDPGIPHFRMITYCDRMDLALAAASVAVSRAGAATVSELSALGIPAVYVPYPVGNGEQWFNIKNMVTVGGGIAVADKNFSPQWVNEKLIPLLTDCERLTVMSQGALSAGVRDGTQRMVHLIDEAIRSSPSRSNPE